MSSSEDRLSGIPWWLEPGPQTCDFCLCDYHCEAGCYCPQCDRPVCPLCMVEVEVRVRHTPLCPECHAGGE